MKNPTHQMEIKVGAVAIAAVMAMAALFLLLSNIQLGSKFRVNVEFKFSGAVSEGAPVKISGVTIGKVEKIEFIGHLNAQSPEKAGLQTRLSLAIDQDKRGALPEGTRFYVSTANVLGEPFIEAVPGGQYATLLSDGATVRGIDPPRTDLLFSQANTVMEAFAGLLQGNRNELKDLIQSLAGMSQSLNGLLSDKRAVLGKSVDNLAQLSGELRDLSIKINQGLGTSDDVRTLIRDVRSIARTLSREIPELSSQAKTTLREGTRTLDEVGDLLRDEKTHIQNTLKQLDKTTAHAAVLVEDTQVVVKKMKNAEGTVGALLNDEEIYDDLKELMSDLKKHPWKILWRD